MVEFWQIYICIYAHYTNNYTYRSPNPSRLTRGIKCPFALSCGRPSSPLHQAENSTTWDVLYTSSNFCSSRNASPDFVARTPDIYSIINSQSLMSCVRVFPESYVILRIYPTKKLVWRGKAVIVTVHRRSQDLDLGWHWGVFLSFPSPFPSKGGPGCHRLENFWNVRCL